MISLAVAPPSTWRREELISGSSRSRATVSLRKRAVEGERVGDAVAHESVDHQALLVGGDHLLLAGLDGLVALVQR